MWEIGRCGVVAWFVGTMLFPLRAGAFELGLPLDRTARWRVDGEVGLAGDADAHSTTYGLSPLFRCSYRIAGPWSLWAEGGLAWMRSAPDHGDSSWALAPSNLVLGGMLEDGDLEGGWAAVRASLAAPTARLPSNGPARGFARSAYAFALAARGLFRPWTWAPNQAAVAVEGAAITSRPLGRRSRSHFVAGVEAGTALTVPVADPGTSAQMFGQLAGQVGVGSAAFDIGPRAQLVWMPFADAATVQTSLGAAVDVYIGPRGLVRAQLLRHFDAPLGDGLGSVGFVIGGSGAW